MDLDIKRPVLPPPPPPLPPISSLNRCNVDAMPDTKFDTNRLFIDIERGVKLKKCIPNDPTTSANIKNVQLNGIRNYQPSPNALQAELTSTLKRRNKQIDVNELKTNGDIDTTDNFRYELLNDSADKSCSLNSRNDISDAKSNSKENILTNNIETDVSNNSNITKLEYPINHSKPNITMSIIGKECIPDTKNDNKSVFSCSNKVINMKPPIPPHPVGVTRDQEHFKINNDQIEEITNKFNNNVEATITEPRLTKALVSIASEKPMLGGKKYVRNTEKTSKKLMMTHGKPNFVISNGVNKQFKENNPHINNRSNCDDFPTRIKSPNPVDNVNNKSSSTNEVSDIHSSEQIELNLQQKINTLRKTKYLQRYGSTEMLSEKSDSINSNLHQLTPSPSPLTVKRSVYSDQYKCFTFDTKSFVDSQETTTVDLKQKLNTLRKTTHFQRYGSAELLSTENCDTVNGHSYQSTPSPTPSTFKSPNFTVNNSNNFDTIDFQQKINTLRKTKHFQRYRSNEMLSDNGSSYNSSPSQPSSLLTDSETVPTSSPILSPKPFRSHNNIPDPIIPLKEPLVKKFSDEGPNFRQKPVISFSKELNSSPNRYPDKIKYTTTVMVDNDPLKNDVQEQLFSEVKFIINQNGEILQSTGGKHIVK